MGADGGRGAPPPWKKLASSLALVYKKLAPPLIHYREGNKANSPLPLDVQKLKAFQLQGLRPMTRGVAAVPRWRLCPQALVIGAFDVAISIAKSSVEKL